MANDRALEIADMFGDGRGYSVGYVIPDNGDGMGVRSEAGSTLGTGVFARKSIYLFVKYRDSLI